MSSIIGGYNYDIFISYRQKDNKGDGWVSKFVEALKTELESTFKEEISVYFDINPHDGLLETHDVDESLKEKLKCLIFIPVISRTYCDPNSFAWEHEFRAFVKQASNDQFGLKIKLPNGNVASRVLPVRVHDLDTDDLKLCEAVLGGVLRGIEFIYKEPGVNKPLTIDDDERKNLNNTKYKIQINKTANAINEIIQGVRAKPMSAMTQQEQQEESFNEGREKERKIETKKPVKSAKGRWISVTAITVILIAAGIFLCLKIFKQGALEKPKSSNGSIIVAVMPFNNMTNDTTWNVWQAGIQNELITSLTNYEELKVRQTGSINDLIQSKGLTNYASITPSIANTLSQKLDANVFIIGSIIKADTTIRVNAQLIDSKTKENIRSFQIAGTADNILHTIDSLSEMVRDFLIVTEVKKEIPREVPLISSSDSPDAYRYFIYGDNAYFKRDWPTAEKYYSQAVDIDSNFFSATIRLSWTLAFQGFYDKAKECFLKVYQKRYQMPLQQKIWSDHLNAFLFETPYEELKYLRQLLEFDGQVPLVHESIGSCYYKLLHYDRAIPEYEKALEIYDKWGVKPLWVYSYYQLGTSYHKTGHYSKERKLYKKAEQDFPNDHLLLYNEAVLSLTKGYKDKANRYIDQYISSRKESSVPEAVIFEYVALIYSDAGVPDKAEEFLRKALLIEPENSEILNNLAWLLIDKDRNISEGLMLIDKALEISPDVDYILDTKGWGLYKQGKYKESLALFEKAWNLAPVYDHDIYLHLEAAKKAVARQKNN